MRDRLIVILSYVMFLCFELGIILIHLDIFD